MKPEQNLRRRSWVHRAVAMRPCMRLPILWHLGLAMLGSGWFGLALADNLGSASSGDAGPSPAVSSSTNAGTTPELANPVNPWKIAAGPGLILSPKYPGSGQLKLLPVPSQDISYNDRIFSQGLDLLGINALKGDAYHVGASLSLDFQSRKASDDARLHGLKNVDEGPKFRLFADYSWSLLTASVAALQDISGTGQGLLVSADLVANLPVTPKFLMSFGPGATWANSTYTRTLFGITAGQSAASGLPRFNTSPGIRDIHLNAYFSYQFSARWSGALGITAGRLEHDAAGSPITERRRELVVLQTVNYRFR